MVTLDDLNEKGRNDSRIQSMFKRSRHDTFSNFLFSQDYYELRKRTIRANGSFCPTFKPNNYRGEQSLYQDKASTDMTYNEYKYSTSTFWDEKFQPLTIDTAKDKYTGRYRLGLNFLFIPNTNPF